MEVDVGVDLKYDSGPPSDDDLVDIDVKDDGDVKIDTLLAAGGDISHDVGDGIMKDILNDATFDLVRAEAAYRQVLDVDSSHMHTLYAFGQLLSAKGDHREAAKTFEAATAGPNSAKVWMSLGVEYQTLDRHEDALEAFREVLALNPGLTLAQYSLTQSLIQLRRMDEAAAVIQEMRRSAPTSKGAALIARALLQLDTKRKNVQLSKPPQPRPSVKLAKRLVASTALPVLLTKKGEAGPPNPLQRWSLGGLGP